MGSTEKGVPDVVEEAQAYMLTAPPSAAVAVHDAHFCGVRSAPQPSLELWPPHSPVGRT